MNDTETVRESRRKRGIYLLPNLFTTGTLFAGFYSIIAATQGRFVVAAVAIFVAMLTDMLDGRVARLTHTESDFGIQYDSLADLVSFGLASGLLAYLYSLESLAYYSDVAGKLGWLAAFFYAASAALRLARFNITRGGATEKKIFLGLPSPAAAGLLVGFVWVGADFGIQGSNLVVFVFALTVIAGVLMVSNVRYDSFKDLNFGERVPFRYILFMLIVFVAIVIDPPRVLFLGFLVYALSGPVQALRRRRRRQPRA
ncbi:CDP-diacylglycerol--serine O-phosphatidyltransferase [Endozoicomonas sp. G2_2]|uniref:CDP-diacylglycerol--serine O-phosphatidyltransferase n=1 Tax=Gammaproteobacteria TaxID=1236 RepID=UPI000C477EBB|nr:MULTISPECIES: CDP-diacylglycerol--serine O-phosphatidyltransferase [Gammaproteobacteria]MAS09636.1 CDP-diacylglycerol--serine O-phosphatidyltransferase [Salinisphaera sp.]MBO9470353.1 CDP-diacylglycerol--serine O-phosphatidyltransferase [Endozoicomonas sp. G2_2]